MEVKYYCMNPTGNRTILIRQPDVGSSLREAVWGLAAGTLLKQLPEMEQAGRVDFPEEGGALPSLRMAGGEFCGNASLAAAALYARLKNKPLPFEMKLAVSGTASPVRVSLTAEENGLFTGEVTMPEAGVVKELTLPFGGGSVQLPCVSFEGISHLIVMPESLPDVTEEEAERLVRSWCELLRVSGLGLLFTEELMPRETAENAVRQLRVRPLIYIPGIPSLHWESSCASGSAALAVWFAAHFGREVRLNLSYPAGILSASACPGEHPRVGGKVCLEKEGSFTL